MDRVSFRIREKLVSQWDDVKATLEKLSTVAEVRPGNGWEVLRAQPSLHEVVKFGLSPVVFNLPEGAKDTGSDLFVVVEGWLAVERQPYVDDELLVTHDFGTHAAYFRRSRHHLCHVYGVHHDFSPDRLGHPTFHSQMKSFSKLAHHVAEHYRVAEPVVDQVQHVLRTARMPSAQMDIFSLFVQICADHLLCDQSGPEEKLAFNTLLKKGQFLKGAGAGVSRRTEATRECYRAPHWYPLVT